MGTYVAGFGVAHILRKGQEDVIAEGDGDEGVVRREGEQRI